MEEEQSLWMSPASNSMLSTTLGRVMSTLLSARPKKLEAAISRLDSAPKSGSFASLEESLRILHTYVRDAAQRNEALDGILVPMIEHSLKHKESKLGCQAMILFNWLFQDEILFQDVVTNLARIIRRKEDHYIALGWCLLVRGLVEYEITMKVFMNNGIRDKYCSLLKTFSSCITHLTSIVSNGSTLQEGFELPTRLSVAAADCILALTIALTKRDLVSDGSDDRPKPSNPSLSNLPISSVPAVFSETKVKSSSKSLEVSSNLEMKLLLWDHLDSLIILVQRLSAWNKKSRPLHAKGVERVIMWLQGIKRYYVHGQNEADGSQLLRTGVLLLSSCWKHYGMLMLLEDYRFSQQYKELLDQYLSGIEFYADNTVEHTENKDSGIETIKFFLNCLSLLLGHFDGKQLENVISEYGLRISRVLISQLHHADEHVIDGAVCILKAVIFRTNYALSRGCLPDTREMDAVLPLLLHLLDERDGTARAVVTLIAEYCSISTDNRCIQEVLKRLASGDASQRRNAVDVVSELFCISPDPVNINSWQDIANHLLERLGDEELEIRVQASNLIPMMDPSLVLPTLIGLSYSSDEVVQSSACNTIVSVLKRHSKQYEILCMLLDCLGNLCENKDHPETSGGSGKGGSKLDADRVLKLIPQWSDSVEDWNLLIEPLIDKMFAGPSNAIIVRFLSCISEHLADAADVVFHRLLLHTRHTEESETKKYGTGSSAQLEHSLFEHLCPLLIIRLLPLRVFNDLNSSLMYGELCTRGNPNTGYFDINDVECVSGILLNRAFNKFEFEDVRKLAAELCGRIHPQVLLPIAASQLATAATAHDVLKIKTCLFSICTSLVVRGKDSILHPVLPKIRNSIEAVLLWPSLDGDNEVSKAQHGCIDCLALMICAELQAPESFISDLTSKKPRDGAVRNSVLGYVIYQLNSNREVSVSLSFRLCMANILISACQKISDAGKKPFARKILPHLIRSVGVMMESEIRAACIQVFFSAVYYLKSAVLPYASDLLSLSVKALKEGSEKEKLAGAKLMAALMASEESVVESIAGRLLEARTLLSSISSADPSPVVRQMSQKLLACLTSM